MVTKIDQAVAQNKTEDVDIFIHTCPFCEICWTTGDVFDLWGVRPQCPHYGRTQQYWANQYIMHVNSRTRLFIQHWANLMAKTRLLIGKNQTLPNAKSFWEHREDQSFFSL